VCRPRLGYFRRQVEVSQDSLHDSRLLNRGVETDQPATARTRGHRVQFKVRSRSCAPFGGPVRDPRHRVPRLAPHEVMILSSTIVIDGDADTSQQVDMPIERFQKIAAVFVILMVILVYAYCLGLKRIYPPSHPWSGITLMLLSVGLLLKSRGPVGLRWVLSGATVFSAGLWAFAAIRNP
jgi:hypothetical protein